MKKTAAEIRADMTDFCLREAFNGAGDDRVNGYVAALTSVAHLCDQIAAESRLKAERVAAIACGDFIWSVAEAVKKKRDAKEVA